MSIVQHIASRGIYFFQCFHFFFKMSEIFSHLIPVCIGNTEIQNGTLIESNQLPLGSTNLSFPDLKIFGCRESQGRESLGSALASAPFSVSALMRGRGSLSDPSFTARCWQSHWKLHGRNQCRAEQRPACVALALLILKGVPWRTAYRHSFHVFYGCSWGFTCINSSPHLWGEASPGLTPQLHVSTEQ